MRTVMTPLRCTGCLIALLIVADSRAARAQQVPDSTFDTHVARPAFVSTHPKLMFDEGHHEFHTTADRYRGFSELAQRDGFAVSADTNSFTKARLSGTRILVIGNALGAESLR